MSSDQLRVLWIVVGGIGSVAGIVGVGIMLWLRGDALRFVTALGQVTRPYPNLSMYKQHVEGDVRDQTVLTFVAGVLFATVFVFFAAGVAAVLGMSPVAITLILLGELLLAGDLVAVVVLGLVKLRHRQELFRSVRMNRQAR